MKTILTTIFLVGLLLFSFTSAFTEESKDAILESISYQTDPELGETISFKLNGTHLPKIFAIKGEKPRVVFDFHDTRYSDLINKIIETEGSLVKRVRVGLHNEPTPKTRVVVDLAPRGEFEYEQDFIVQENILTISIFEPGQAEKPKKEDLAVTPEADAPPDDGLINLKRDKNKKILAQKTIKEEAGEDKKNGLVKEETVSQPPSVTETIYPSADEVVIDKSNNAEVSDEQEKKSPHLLDISFEVTEDKGEMVLFKLNDFYPPIVFGIEKGSPRVVCDFLDTSLSEKVTAQIISGGKFVDRIRTAKHEDPSKVRVVLDLVPNRNYDLQQVFFKEDNLFMIIVNSFDTEFSTK